MKLPGISSLLAPTPHTTHLCHQQLPPSPPSMCTGNTGKSTHPCSNWDLTFLMTAFNTALRISFPEKVPASKVELLVQNICKNQASPADEITSRNMSELWWKNVCHFTHDAWQLVLGNPASASEHGQVKVQVKIMMGRGFACLLNWTCIFFFVGKSFYALLICLDVMFILLRNYLHIPVFWSRNIEITIPK